MAKISLYLIVLSVLLLYSCGLQGDSKYNENCVYTKNAYDRFFRYEGQDGCDLIINGSRNEIIIVPDENGEILNSITLNGDDNFVGITNGYHVSVNDNGSNNVIVYY